MIAVALFRLDAHVFVDINTYLSVCIHLYAKKTNVIEIFVFKSISNFRF